MEIFGGYDSDTLYINRERSIVMDVDIFRRVDDPASERITGKASEDIIFGQWFQRMIDDCNLKSPLRPSYIRMKEEPITNGVFYTKPSFFKRRRYIDPTYTCRQQAEKTRCNHSQALWQTNL